MKKTYMKIQRIIPVAIVAGIFLVNESAKGQYKTETYKNLHIFFGGADHLDLLDKGVEKLINSGEVGLYEHANGLAQLTQNEKLSLQKRWAITGASLLEGGGRGMAEVGEFQPNAAYLSYFGGKLPTEVNMNVVGTGSYSDGKNYFGHFFSKFDLMRFKKYTNSYIQYGAENVAPIITSNSFNEKTIGTDFSRDGFWKNARLAALYAGAIALDVPPTYAFWQGKKYLETMLSEIKWGISNHLRVTLILSPFNPSHAAWSAPDPNFLVNTQKLVNFLNAKRALPTSYVVETYCGCNTTNQALGDAVHGSTNEVAIFLLTQPVSKRGSARPHGPDGKVFSEKELYK